jgi:predicted transcriptional regulator
MSLREIQNILNAQSIGPEELMRCALGIKTTEIRAYCILVNKGPITIQEATEFMNKSRSTAQRLLQNLVEKGLAIRDEELIGLGGYKFIYRSVPPEMLKASIKDSLDRWYKKMIEELDDLPEKIAKLSCDV